MQDVTVSHPRTPRLPLLTGVDWQVQTGDFWVVTGMQGSGKTALLETAAGLHPRLAGDLRVLGEDMAPGGSADHPEFRRRVGLVFDGQGRLFTGLTVFENVALPVCYHDNASLEAVTPWVQELLLALELDRIPEVGAGKLGRSWARRVALARALALKPELLLLDTPLTGRDAAHLRWWRTFLLRLRAGHPLLGGVPLTLVVASDEVRPLLSMGSQFALVHDGQWRVVGDRAALERAEEPLVRELLEGND
jgi:phospholipid/cholesterol/gamma-HCH transport system ATP-binding protein